jgi:hypothetical protein
VAVVAVTDDERAEQLERTEALEDRLAELNGLMLQLAAQLLAGDDRS